MSIVTLDGGFVHYEVLGRGRPLIFLHGWVGSWRYWIPTMQAASISFRTYALDQWGFGDTAKNYDLYSLDNQVNLLVGFLEQMGIGKIALVGHGLGAVIGMWYASRYPTSVDRMMVTSFPLGGNAINPRLRSASISELVDWMLVRSPVSDAARIEAPKADQRAILSSLDSMQSINLMELAMQLPTPCLYVYGENDPAVSIQPENLSALPDHMHVVPFEQSGHFPMLDEPTKYNRLLADFLALASGESPRQLQLKEEWKRRVR